MKHVRTLQCPVIVGRDDILDVLDEAVAETARGRGRALFLSGQAGLGKTRLLRATVRKAVAAGVLVNGGSVAPQDHSVPLASIREMAVGMRGDPDWGSLSEDLLAIDGRHDGDSLGSRRVIVRTAADRILEAIQRPTLLLFDDLHWTDELSLEVIGELIRHRGDRPLSILAGYRADEFPPKGIHREWRSRALSQRHAEEIRLRRLTLDETAIATTLIIGGELPAPRDVALAIYQRTNGIPLHIEELLAALDDAARLDGRRIREASVPDTIGDAVLARLSRLPDDVRLVARAGAVVGRCFSPDVLAGIVGRPLPELESAIQELVDASILYPFDYIDQGYYDFRHQLLRDAIYGVVPPSELRRFHAQAAEFVMTLEAASVVHASRHYERAGLRPQAFQTSLTAAGEASRISARQEAFELYQRAITNMPDGLSTIEQAELYGAYSIAASAIEQNDESVKAAIIARDLYQAAGRPIEALDCELTCVLKATRDGEPSAGIVRTVNAIIADVEALPPSPERDGLRAQAIHVLAFLESAASRFDLATTHAEQAIEVAAAAGDRESTLDAMFTRTVVDVLRGDLTSGLDRALTIAREARDAGFESVGVTALRNVGVLSTRVLDFPTARIAIAEGLQYADAIEQSHCRQQMAVTQAVLDWADGRWDDADRIARQELVERGCRRGVVSAIDALGLVAMSRGRVEEAHRWYDEAFAAAEHMDEVAYLLPSLWGLAELDLVAGDPAAGAARCETARALASDREERALLIPFVVTGTRALLAAGRPQDAERWVAAMRSDLVGWDSAAAAAIAHADGLVRMSAGNLVSARDALTSAVDSWEKIGRIWETSWARLDLAQCLLRTKHFVEAASLLSRVGQTAANLQSAPLVARVEELARLGRGRGSLEEPWRPLTAREFEVARLIAEGLTNSEIAERLTIAPKTASAHVEHILAKLDVTRRAEIAAWTATIVHAPAPAANADRPAVAARA